MVYPLSKSPEEKKPKTVGVDANLARHLNFIFAPGTTAGERVKQWVTKHPTTGRPVAKKIAVLGTLGAPELRTFLVLCKLRQESSGPDVQFSLQGTAKLAQLTWHGRGGTNTKRARPSARHGGKSTAESLRDALMHLRFGGLILTNVYFDPEKGEFITAEGVTILDKLRVVQHTPINPDTGELDPSATTLHSLFRFNPMIEKTIAGGVLKPIVLDALLSIDKRATAATYAYLYLDRKLYKRSRWTEPSAALLPNIQMTGTYRRPAERKRVLDTIAKHLDGLPISTGYLRVAVTKRAGDWCLSTHKLTSRHALDETRANAADNTPEDPERRRATLDTIHTTIHPQPVPTCARCRERHETLTLLRNTIANLAAKQGTPANNVAAPVTPPAVAPAAPAEPSDATPHARPPGVAPGEVPPA